MTSLLPFVTIISRLAISGVALTAGASTALVVTASGSSSVRSAPPMDLRMNVSKADSSIGISVQAVTSKKNSACEGTVHLGKRKLTLPHTKTGGQLAVQWAWRVGGKAPAGRWVVKVTCRVKGHLRHRTKSMPVDHGIGPGSRGQLVAPGTFTKRAVAPTNVRPGGQGGSSNAASLYPRGQCTWWVATLRPDLPFFSGVSGDALNWTKSAAKAGFVVDDRPAVGAVAVFQPGQYGAGRYGHVAYVTQVNGGQITISESNFEHGRLGTQRPVSWSGLRFIYGGPAGKPPTDTQPLTTTTAPTTVTVPPVPATVSLAQPRADQWVSGTVRVTATSNAAAVRFEVFAYANPAQSSTGHTTVLTTDADGSDGFATDWDSTSVLNQGGPGGSSVVVRAIALDAGGKAGAEATARVNVANSALASGITYWPYYVVGTCAEGACFLNTRQGPGFSGYASTGQRQDGDEVRVVCQAVGERVEGTLGGSSIWDKLVNGDWVADYYVDTPLRDAFSPPIPHC